MEEKQDKYKNKKSQQSQQGREGCASQTFQQNDTKSPIFAPGDEKDYSDNIGLALAKLGARSNNYMAKAKSDTSKEFPDKREQSFGTQGSIKKLSEEDSQLTRDKNLLKLGVITKEQFNRKWGGKE